MRFSVTQIAKGRRGTDETVRIMEKLVTASQRAPWLRERALDILRQRGITDTHDPQPAATAIFDWVKRNIAFIHDPVQTDTLQEPEVTLRYRAGDCDDHAILVAALAETIGIPSRFLVVGASPDRFEHVLCQVWVRGRWATADTAESDQLGTAVPQLGAIKSYSPIEANMYTLGESQYSRPSGEVAAQQAAMYGTAKNYLETRWREGRVTKQDVDTALMQIDSPASPIPAPYVGGRRAIRAALKDFRVHLERTRGPLPMPAVPFYAEETHGMLPMAAVPSGAEETGSMLSEPDLPIGLRGMGGLLGDVWDVVSGAATGAWTGIKSLIGIGGADPQPIIIEHKTDYTIPIVMGAALIAVMLFKK